MKKPIKKAANENIDCINPFFMPLKHAKATKQMNITSIYIIMFFCRLNGGILKTMKNQTVL
jgi:hypothetical protein